MGLFGDVLVHATASVHSCDSISSIMYSTLIGGVGWCLCGDGLDATLRNIRDNLWRVCNSKAAPE